MILNAPLESIISVIIGDISKKKTNILCTLLYLLSSVGQRFLRHKLSHLNLDLHFGMNSFAASNVNPYDSLHMQPAMSFVPSQSQYAEDPEKYQIEYLTYLFRRFSTKLAIIFLILLIVQMMTLISVINTVKTQEKDSQELNRLQEELLQVHEDVAKSMQKSGANMRWFTNAEIAAHEKRQSKRDDTSGLVKRIEVLDVEASNLINEAAHPDVRNYFRVTHLPMSYMDDIPLKPGKTSHKFKDISSNIPNDAKVLLIKFIVRVKGQAVEDFIPITFSWFTDKDQFSIVIPVVLKQQINLRTVVYDTNIMYIPYSASKQTFTLEMPSMANPTSDSRMTISLEGYLK